tara:strand:+ start:1930 stop:2190 length:261 start_codon:yes stop_codon:yes gene_type:complete
MTTKNQAPADSPASDCSALREFDVCIPITGTIWVTVEAENEADAIKKGFASDDISTANIEEWECHEHICEGNVLHASTNSAYAEES